MAKDSSYQVHKISKRKLVSTELERFPKGIQFLPSSLGDRRIFVEFAVLTEFSWLTQEVIFWTVFTEQGRPVKELINF